MNFEIYQAQKKHEPGLTEWRWRLVRIINNKILANSEDGFETIEACKENIYFIMMLDYSTPIIVIDKKKFTFDLVSEIVHRMKSAKHISATSKKV